MFKYNKLLSIGSYLIFAIISSLVLYTYHIRHDFNPIVFIGLIILITGIFTCFFIQGMTFRKKVEGMPNNLQSNIFKINW